MSKKSETYKSKAARAKHERSESTKEMKKEYGAKQTKIKKVMREYKAGTLHSGKNGKIVKNPKQAVAIALSVSRKKTKKR